MVSLVFGNTTCSSGFIQGWGFRVLRGGFRGLGFIFLKFGAVGFRV